MKIAHVNQDPGVAPGRKKGAAVHVEAMRRAFGDLGARCVEIDHPDDREAFVRLEVEHAGGPLALVYERHALDRFASAEFARRHGVPHVIEINAPLEEEDARYRGGARDDAARVRERAAFAGATLVIAVSSAVARYAEERGADPARVLVRPNAVDPALFRPRAPGDAWRERLVPAGRTALGFHGRLRPWHNVELLVDTCDELLARGREIQLVLLGEGAFEAAWRGRLPPDRVSHVAWLPHAEAAGVVAAFDLLPLTYAPDAPCYFSPLKLMEAMSAGVVPIVPDLGDLATAVGRGAHGRVYSAGSRAGLVACIEALLDDPAARAALAASAREHARSHAWIDIAREVVERAAAGGSA